MIVFALPFYIEERALVIAGIPVLEQQPVEFLEHIIAGLLFSISLHDPYAYGVELSVQLLRHVVMVDRMDHVGKDLMNDAPICFIHIRAYDSHHFLLVLRDRIKIRLQIIELAVRKDIHRCLCKMIQQHADIFARAGTEGIDLVDVQDLRERFPGDMNVLIKDGTDRGRRDVVPPGNGCEGLVKGAKLFQALDHRHRGDAGTVEHERIVFVIRPVTQRTDIASGFVVDQAGSLFKGRMPDLFQDIILDFGMCVAAVRAGIVFLGKDDVKDGMRMPGFIADRSHIVGLQIEQIDKKSVFRV